MRKRITAGLVATTATFAMLGASPALAYDDDSRDKHPPIPCNPYPPGKPFNVTAIPSAATVKKNAYVNLTATVTRGVGTDKKPCKYHLVILRYKSRPGQVVKAHRTGENGSVGFVAGPIPSKLYYFFDLLYNNQYTSSNTGVISVN